MESDDNLRKTLSDLRRLRDKEMIFALANNLDTEILERIFDRAYRAVIEAYETEENT